MSSKRRTGTSLPRRRSSRASSPPTSAQHRGISRRQLFSVAGIAVLGTAGVIAAGNLLREDDGSVPVSRSADIPTTERVKGIAAAPVTIVEYADLQCPVCARFSRTIEPQIETAFIAPGVAKLEFRHFAFLGKESLRAAAACECAAEQGAFFTYRDALYAAQSGENRGAFNDDALRRIASEIGLDTRAFDDALASGRHAGTVTRQTAEGQAMGVKATPTFIINGTKLEGLASFDTYRRVIEQAAGSAS
ncbi:MAG: DsbA family protein [Dehalococcoidia bacterium]